MALFFDKAWYDARLAERGLDRTVLAAAAGMSEAELALAFKDQRELSMREVSVFAELLGVPAAEAASRAGVRPPPVSDAQRIAALEARVAALEAELAALKR
ncbi:helix-turn-helix domain-containing protein [uncultured Caulobacter sp.]|uniref:helix-turn-helix domain-containing protein n=1 Tax=uncultured Caulobacter sp. TaxID=158749 RepID=UPI00262786C3|nr:helix-turn-helix domain-containing protein [uncultured Caulobacter sp.]